MSSARRAEPVLTEEPGLELTLLCDALDIGSGGAFLFVVCEEGPLRERLVRHVREHLEEQGRDLVEVELSPDQPNLAGQLEQRIPYELPDGGKGGLAPIATETVRERPHPPVVFVHTHELADADGVHVASLSADHPERVRVEQIRRALRALNFQRERLGRLNLPLVFWLSQNALVQVTRHAADVFAARSGIFSFEAPVREPGAPSPMRAEAIASLLDRFHRTFLPPEELRRRAALYEQRLERERAADKPNWPRVALLCQDLASIHHELDDYAQVGEFQDEAIGAYERAIAERGEEAGDREQETESKRQEWARLQSWLGLAYYERIRGERAENLERAITCYQAALEVHTRDTFPEEWAWIQGSLGTAYADRIRGERAENLERAIECFQAALEVYTRDAFPAGWAATQNNLGEAYRNRIRGERAENLEQAIEYYQAALKVHSRDAFPVEWAATQNDLGNAYIDRIRGKRAENLERAIACFQAALAVYSRDTFLIEWARTQNNLGVAHFNRIRGERAKNLERTLECYQAALEVYIRDAFPVEWAMIQNNMGNTYAQRIGDERADNMEQAIACFRAALEVRTRDAFPVEWAATQNNLGNAYLRRIHGERAENLEWAIACFRAALEVRTRDTFPFDWAQTQNNLGLVYADRIRGERTQNREQAVNCLKNALTVFTAEAFPHHHETTTHNLERVLSELRQDGKPQLQAMVDL